MPFLERSPFRWSHVVLPGFYLFLGAAIGYVAPIMWGARPGKTQVQKMRDTNDLNRSQLLGEVIVGRFSRMAHALEKEGLLAIDHWDSGLGMSWANLPDGSRRISQDWRIHLAAPQEDPAKRLQVEERYAGPRGRWDFRGLNVRKVTWPDSRTVEVSFDWILPADSGRYQTTNFLEELRW